MAHATWRALLRAQRLRVTLAADGHAIPARPAALTITVNRVNGSSPPSFDRGQRHGGSFSIYIVDTFGLNVLLALLLRVLCKRRSDSVREYRASEIDITGSTRSMRVMNDGELTLLIPPLRYRIRRGALHVLVGAP